MEETLVENEWVCIQKTDTDYLNPVEEILKKSGTLGLSIRQLESKLNINKRSVKYFIYSSHYIEDTPPWIHGSLKSRIHVFRFTKEKDTYFNRKKKKVRDLEEVPSSP